MKTIISILFVLIFIVACNGQPRSDYDLSCNPVIGANTYHWFLQKKSVTPYVLVQGVDYKLPSVLAYKIGQSTIPTITVNMLLNDGSEYAVGVVADSSGLYSGMGVEIQNAGRVPTIPTMIRMVKR